MASEAVTAAQTPPQADDAFIGRIPVRNLWLLMLYASELFRAHGFGKVAVEENPEDIPDLVGEILAYLVEQRLHRNLSYGYRSHKDVLPRVRGRIDLLTTERHQLMSRGVVACRYDELTVNTPRNRYVRAALEVIIPIVRNAELSHRCRVLAGTFQRLGVSSGKPADIEMSTERYGHHDASDQYMVAAAKLALNLALPMESKGTEPLAIPNREFSWVCILFEKAIGGFYNVVLTPKGWRVSTGKRLNWQIDSATLCIGKILPSMQTDIVLDNHASGERIVIDTKFTSILTKGWHREDTLRSRYIYQIYSYLRSQEGSGDPLAENATGLLLHPSIGDRLDETVVVQGHAIRFVTVDLRAKPGQIREQLLRVVNFV